MGWRGTRGITLIEIVISLGILALLLVPVISLFAAAVNNNRIAGISADTKYVAEKYMEIVKATRIDDLEDVLAGEGFINQTGLYVNPDGVEIELMEIAEYAAGGSVGIENDDYEILADITGVTGDIEIRGIASGLGIELWANGNIFINDFDDPAMYINTKFLEGSGIKLRFNGADSQRVTVYNLSPKELRFYCINEKISGGYYSDRELPTFFIEDGEVAFFDRTVPIAEERLPEELDGMFKGSGSLTLTYVVRIRVDNENGVYTLEGLKVIN